MFRELSRMKIKRDELLRGYNIFLPDKELKEAQMDYYKLGKEERWLGDDSPSNVGGRDTDVSQIAFSLSHRVRGLYSINKVPRELADKLDELESICYNCEKAITDAINLISDAVVMK